jgi:hypothetical protein
LDNIIIVLWEVSMGGSRQPTSTTSRPATVINRRPVTSRTPPRATHYANGYSRFLRTKKDYTPIIVSKTHKTSAGHVTAVVLLGDIVELPTQRYLVTEVLNMWEVSMGGSHSLMEN